MHALYPCIAGIAPGEWTTSNIATMREQMDMLGLNFDWEREVSTANRETLSHELFIISRVTLFQVSHSTVPPVAGWGKAGVPPFISLLE